MRKIRTWAGKVVMLTGGRPGDSRCRPGRHLVRDPVGSLDKTAQITETAPARLLRPASGRRASGRRKRVCRHVRQQGDTGRLWHRGTAMRRRRPSDHGRRTCLRRQPSVLPSGEPTRAGQRHRLADLPSDRLGRFFRGTVHDRTRRSGQVALPRVRPAGPGCRVEVRDRRRAPLVTQG